MKHFSIEKHTTPGQLKEQYRILCKKHHPDRGGNTGAMAEVNHEYKHALQMLAKRTKDIDILAIIEKQLEDHLTQIYNELKIPVFNYLIPDKYKNYVRYVIKNVSKYF